VERWFTPYEPRFGPRDALGPFRPTVSGMQNRPMTEPRDTWRAQLDDLTEQFAGGSVTIELLDREFGDEEEAERLPLAFIEYDPKDDVVIVAVGGRSARYPVVLRHIVQDPRNVVVDTLGDGDDAPAAVDVAGGDGGHTIVTIHRPG
jgi:hypothetical protein